MKFKLVETLQKLATHDILTSELFINELQEQFGSDFSYKPLCKEVTQYICNKFSNVKGLYNNVIVCSYTEEDGLTPVSVNGHCVVMFENKIYDYTSNQYAHYPNIEESVCPRVLEHNEELSSIVGKCYSCGTYVIITEG